MNSRGVQVFVYYRIRVADAATAIAAVVAFQDRLNAAIPGLNGRLSRRVEDRADLLTLMETYVHADPSSPDWQREIESRAQEQLAAWIVGERHVEVFAPCA